MEMVVRAGAFQPGFHIVMEFEDGLAARVLKDRRKKTVQGHGDARDDQSYAHGGREAQMLKIAFMNGFKMVVAFF
jgi:hypothetical protein